MTGLYPDAPKATDVPFTDAARQLLADARAEAARLGHECTGTEHVVLAMTQNANATALLTRCGIDGEQLRASLLEAVVTPGRAALPSGPERPYTSRTRQAFGLALENARAHGHEAVGIEHLVVGLLREQRSIGAQALQHHGLTVELATAELRSRDDGRSARRD